MTSQALCYSPGFLMYLRPGWPRAQRAHYPGPLPLAHYPWRRTSRGSPRWPEMVLVPSTKPGWDSRCFPNSGLSAQVCDALTPHPQRPPTHPGRTQCQQVPAGAPERWGGEGEQRPSSCEKQDDPGRSRAAEKTELEKHSDPESLSRRPSPPSSEAGFQPVRNRTGHH